MNQLQKIIDAKHLEVEKLLPRMAELQAAAKLRTEFRSFAGALDRGAGRLRLIAEVKKGSPSAGTIAADFDPVSIARSYEAGGAHAISVLTDEDFFQGHLSHLTAVRRAVNLPCLRKDFMVHEVQLFEAVAAGADAVLLIVAALPQDRLVELYKGARDLGLDVLVEVHSSEELARAVQLGARIIGINNRNLTNFEVQLETTERLSNEAPDDVILVSESGIRTSLDTRRVVASGCDAVLVGESLMRAQDVAGKILELLDVTV